MSADLLVPQHSDASPSNGNDVVRPSDEATVCLPSPNHTTNKGWEKVRRKVLSIVGASCNFHTLRDMYGEIVLDPSKLKLVKTIADGNYGTVAEFEYIEEDGQKTRLAIKRLRPGDVSAQGFLDFMKEVKILKQLRHSRIAAFRGTGYLPSETPGEEEDDLFLAQELMDGGTLRAKLEEQRTLKDRKLYTLSEGLQWLFDVACALAYLHNSEPLVIHRDLKPENIMLTRDNVAKIVDFGLHKVVDKWEREDARDEDGFYDMTGGTGAYVYMPPEAFLGHRYNHKVDVFSFAIVAWEIVHYQMLITKVCLTGSPTEVKNYAKYVATEGFRPLISGTLPKALAELIDQMWQQDPNKRPEFNEVVPKLRKILEEVKEQEEKEQAAEVTEPEIPRPKTLCGRLWCCFGASAL